MADVRSREYVTHLQHRRWWKRNRSRVSDQWLDYGEKLDKLVNYTLPLIYSKRKKPADDKRSFDNSFDLSFE